HISQYDYVAQFDLLKQMNAGMSTSYDAFTALVPLSEALADDVKSLKSNAQAKGDLKTVEKYDREFTTIEGGTFVSPGFGGVNSDLTQIVYAEDTGDGRPAESVRAAATESCQMLTKDFDAWQKFNASDLPALNTLLRKYNLASLPAATVNAPAFACGQ
ncbi:MAG: hypothetical protein ACYC92_15180, partial [Candidatus Acidiferrales bacterium]